MKNKLIAFVTSAAALSLMVSTAAIIASSRAFSRDGAMPYVSSDNSRVGENQPLDPYFSEEGGGSSEDITASTSDPAESAGLSEDALYLLIYDSGTLFAFDEAGHEVFSAELKAGRLSSNELEMLYGGITVAGGSALREAIEDLLY